MNNDSIRSNRRQLSIATIFCVIIVVLPIHVSFGQTASGSTIDVSGHLDVRAVEGNTAVRNNDFQIGRF